MEIITATQTQNYLGASADGITNERLALIVDLANGIVTDAWAHPVLPAPAGVVAIALEVAARPLRNPKGLSSFTRHVDDASRTERLSDAAARAGVFLTDDERAILTGDGTKKKRRQYGTIRLGIG